jgi:hypothetical protein
MGLHGLLQGKLFNANCNEMLKYSKITVLPQDRPANQQPDALGKNTV